MWGSAVELRVDATCYAVEADMDRSKETTLLD